MTKLFSIIAVACLATTFVACGPSAEEKAKMEEQLKFSADSAAAAIAASMVAPVEEAVATSTDAAAETATTVVEEAKH